jgi:DNA-binding transcriptional ArsR family regulator
MMGQIAWDRRCLLLSNHALVLAVIAADPRVRVKEIAARVEVSERAVESLLNDLTNVGFISRRRVGRRNVYEVHEEMRLRHPLVEHAAVGDLLEALAPAIPDEIPEASFGHAPAAPGFGEHIVACAGDVDAPMVRSHVSSTTKGVMMKRTLVSAIIASLLVFVSAGAAATYGVHYARSHGSACPSGAAASTTPDAAPAGVRAGSRRSAAQRTTIEHRQPAIRRNHPLVKVRSTGATGEPPRPCTRRTAPAASSRRRPERPAAPVCRSASRAPVSRSEPAIGERPSTCASASSHPPSGTPSTSRTDSSGPSRRSSDHGRGPGRFSTEPPPGPAMPTIEVTHVCKS